MTQILGTIANSVGTPLTGVLTVRLVRLSTDDTTDPDSIYTTKLESYTITSGVLDITIPESETYQNSYRFGFTEDGETEELFSFERIVPNVGTVQFASFFPTGITDRNIDTGALRVARLIVRDEALKAALQQPILYSQTVTNQALQLKAFVGKPFAGAINIRSLTVLGLSGYELWDFDVGILNSSGNEEILTPATTTTTTENGRRRVFRTYNISRAASIMGLFILADPQAGANDLNGTLSLAFTENTTL